MTAQRGFRHKNRVTPYGKWSETARVNLNIGKTMELALYVIDGMSKNPDIVGEEGPEIMVGISREGQLMYFNLSMLTHAELGAFHEFMKIAVANAQDIVLKRDATAKEALEYGDDSYVRVYRRVPEIIVREGEKWSYYPRIRRGFEWIAQLVPEFTTRFVNVRGVGKPVLERVEENSGSEDGQS